MSAGYQELFLEKGADFTTSLTLADVNGDPYNLTGFTAKSQVNKSYYSSSATAQFIITIPTPAFATSFNLFFANLYLLNNANCCA